MAARRLRVLLAEKRLSETGIILRSICAGAGWTLEVAYVGAKEELPDALQAHCPDVALLDLSLLQPDAPLQVSVLSRTSLRVPLILFAEPADKPCAVECLSAGARDYLLEGFMDERTVARVLRSVVGVEEEGPAMLEQAEWGAGGKCQLSQSLERADGIAVEMEWRTAPRVSQELIKVAGRSIWYWARRTRGALRASLNVRGRPAGSLRGFRFSRRSLCGDGSGGPRRDGGSAAESGDMWLRIGRQTLRSQRICDRGTAMKAIGVEGIVLNETESPVRVLLLEESLADSQDMLEELRAAGLVIEPTVVATRQEFREAISSQEYSIILSAHTLPDWSGMEAFEELQKMGKTTPFILVAGAIAKEEAAVCLQQGVRDYVLKSHIVRLPGIVRRALEQKELLEANTAAMHALRESERRNRELVENSVYGIFRVALDGSFVFANPTLLQILACSSLPVLQTLNFMDDIFRFPEHCARLISSCRKDGLVHGAETEWRRKDGGLVCVKLHLRYLSVPGSADQMEGIVEDVTELRSLEHQLLQAQKFETIGQLLAGGVAHDFNNVVGAILGWAELGYEESLAFPRIAERFARIREQADRAASLTRELLAFARCQDLQARPVDLNTIIHSLTTFLDKVIGRDIEMKVLPGILQPIQADPVQIEQVLMNLCLNARDAMPEGGRLAIETEMEQLDESFCRYYPYAKRGLYAVLSVSDTGIGMTNEIRERIFEPFFTTKERGTGSGMGLATAYGIVKQHGGFIHVYSEPWQGSLFRVYLPEIDRVNSEIQPSPKVAEYSRATSLNGTETILLAEDHDSVREMVRQWLVNLGYRVLSAANGEEATRLCDGEAPQLAILDVVMPRLGGTATATQLHGQLPALPVLFTSGYSESTGAAASLLPNSYFLQKPYSPTALGRVIRKILDREPETGGLNSAK